MLRLEKKMFDEIRSLESQIYALELKILSKE